MTLALASLTTGTAQVGGTISTLGATPSNGIIFLFIHSRHNTGSDTTITGITGRSGTWTKIGQASGAASSILSLWIGVGCTPGSTTNLTVTYTNTPTAARFAGVSALGCLVRSAYVSGNVKTNQGTTGTSRTVTPNALAQRGNAFLVGVHHQNSEDVTPSQGTEIDDNNSANADGVEDSYVMDWASGAMGGSWTTSNHTSDEVVGAEIVAARTDVGAMSMF